MIPDDSYPHPSVVELGELTAESRAVVIQCVNLIASSRVLVYNRRLRASILFVWLVSEQGLLVSQQASVSRLVIPAKVLLHTYNHHLRVAPITKYRHVFFKECCRNWAIGTSFVLANTARSTIKSTQHHTYLGFHVDGRGTSEVLACHKSYYTSQE
jgi:hypothetical protein